MYDTSVNQNTANRVSSRTHPVRTGISPIGFFIGDIMKQIPLTQGKFALVDDGDFEKLSRLKWHAIKRGYSGFAAARSCWCIFNAKKAQNLYMHRHIIQAPLNKQVDHINHDGLDNRRKNLRLCNNRENQWNTLPRKGTSKYKGVSWHEDHKKWVVRITVEGKKVYLGHYTNEIKAAKAYNRAAKKYFGEFAYLNFKENQK